MRRRYSDFGWRWIIRRDDPTFRISPHVMRLLNPRGGDGQIKWEKGRGVESFRSQELWRGRKGGERLVAGG